MSFTPERVANELRRLSAKLEAKTDDLAELFQSAAEADVAYRVEYAKALLRCTAKTVGEREALATIDTDKLLWDRKVKEAVASAAQESVRSLRQQLSAVQSVGAGVRAEMELSR